MYSREPIIEHCGNHNHNDKLSDFYHTYIRNSFTSEEEKLKEKQKVP